jgi:hypothetical protein
MKNPPSSDYPGNRTLRVERHVGGKIKTNMTQSSSRIDERRVESGKIYLPALDVNQERFVAEQS